MNKKVFVLAGDYGYIRQIETTLKSICYHNSDVKIYIFNQDIPQEWFVFIREKMAYRNSEIVDIKLFEGNMRNWSLPPVGQHINFMTFARYFIPSFVSEDIVLYLDCDLVVTRDLTDLFSIDLTNRPLAAAKVIYGLEDRFNAGVLLINNAYWKENTIQQELIEITEREHGHLPEADQTVLNIVMGENYVLLDDTYNFQIGYDQVADNRGQYFIFELPLTPLPAIIHYLSADKPWNTYSVGRLREVWWKYNQLEWAQINNQEELVVKKSKYQALIITGSQQLEQIDYIINHLSDYNIHIVTFTAMGDTLKSLASYENVKLHPNVMKWMCRKLIEECDVYLDINHEGKFPDVLDWVQGAQKTILTFDNVVNPYHVDHIFPHEKPQDMIDFLKELQTKDCL
ncbi:glycosyltransferase family 8 [Streptococcus mitis SK569]|jgi:family 8 glycosyl transferase|nr:glycosyltransferase family 8 [Streptococcus mitis SK569]MQP96543.1 glycosyl transferase family 8 [Streptococcus mitis]MQQ13900.1 glycosyl transferase family 8 [Streptococcus mitis]MQQ44838.1 glycosyl transferase family 8 [Streptococcus mitis]MQQ46529.1 glycosyl transferase family 8 [Streptococcus mitis]